MLTRVSIAGLALASAALAGSVAPEKPTFSKDVAPIIDDRCVSCHRPGEAAPMPFTSYELVRPWAKAIREQVVARTMPVWLADSHAGSFKNERRLSQVEIDTISNWVANGAPEGDRKQTPVPPSFAEGWQIGKPDLIIDMGKDYDVPATGVVPYQYFVVPTNFTEDKWIEAAEIRTTNRATVHHIIVYLQAPGERANNAGGAGIMAGYGPGEQPMNLEPGTATLVKAGTMFRFQVHYTPNGKAYTDRSYVGLRFAKTPVKFAAATGQAVFPGLKIPPGDSNYEAKSSWTARTDTQIIDLMPHMHVRGKDFKYTIVYPDGREEVLLNVPRYDFNWQLKYDLKETLNVPKGTRIDCVAHYDNSSNNKYNPDPTKEVHWGDQTWEEMMIGFFTYITPVTHAEVAKAE
jgi:hypothetical protein